MGSHFSLITVTTAIKQIGCMNIYQQMPDDLSVSQQCLWRYNRTDKGRARMKRANSNEKGKARDTKYKQAHRVLLSQRASSAQKDNGNYNQIRYRAEHLEEVKLKDKNRAKLKLLTLTAIKKEELKNQKAHYQRSFNKTPRGKFLKRQRLMNKDEPKWRLLLWSDDVRQRDHYQCMNCDSLVRIEAHHVKNKAQYPELMFDLDNGVSLCYDCHRAGHELFVLDNSVRCLN